MAKLLDVAVLNAPAAGGGDVVHNNGQLDLTNGGTTGDDITAIELKDVVQFSLTAYSAGVLQDEEITFNATAAGTYSVTVEHNDELRTYSVTFTAATTGADIVTALIAEFAKYAGSVQYEAVVGATSDDLDVRLLAAGLPNGKMTITSVGSTGTSTTTAYVAPSGIVSELAALTPKATLAGGQYDKFEIIWKKLVAHNAVSGLEVYRTVKTLIYVETNATNAAACKNAIEDVLDGSVITDAEVVKYLRRPKV